MYLFNRVPEILAKFSDQSPNFSKVVPKVVVWENAIFLEFALKLRSRQTAQVSLNFFLALLGPNGDLRTVSPFDEIHEVRKSIKLKLLTKYYLKDY